jgi:hypothetical protein
MSLRPVLPLWIKASLASYFKSQLSLTQFIIEDEPLPSPAPLPRVELRINGPDFCDQTHGYLILEVEINLLTVTIKDLNDLYAHDKLLGQVINTFINGIPVNQITQGGGYYEMLSKQTDVIVTRWGELDKAPDIVQSTCESSYTMLVPLGDA